MNNDRIAALAKGHRDYVVAMRRALHQIPELAFAEVKTAALLARELTAMGYAPQTGLAKTGVMAVLDTGRPGPCVLLRADMDGLPMDEETGLEFASRHPGCMHGCGHDAHMAILLTVARILREEADSLCGVVKLVFQPAEEFPGGALPMIEEGVMADPPVDFAFGLHVWEEAAVGTVEVGDGAIMAAADQFEITITGKGGHAAQPHLCVDALEIGSQVVGALQRLVSRKLDPLKPGLLTVGTFQAGHAANIIAGQATLTGTVRTFDQVVRDQWEAHLHRVTGGICEAMGATYTLRFSPGYPPVINDSAMADLVRKAAAATVGAEKVRRPAPTMGGEDMAYFLERAPGCLFYLGTGYQGTKPIHHPGFTISEESLPIGVEVFCRIVYDLLAQ